MPRDSADPGSPTTWMRSALEDLALAEARVAGVGAALFCFHAQQAAEKAIKAVLIVRAAAFPYVHDLARLLEVAREAGVAVPPQLVDVDLLTDYATLARYPGFAEIGEQDRDTAVAIARAVVEWAESELAS